MNVSALNGSAPRPTPRGAEITEQATLQGHIMSVVPVASTPAVLAEAIRLSGLGYAVHWLKPATKLPIGKGWQLAPVMDVDALRASYQPGQNVGIRCGRWSQPMPGYGLVILDLDAIDAQAAQDCYAAAESQFGDLARFPTVRSGSGFGLHLYAVADLSCLPASQDAAKSGDMVKVNGKLKHRWRVQILSTSAQVVAPPSVHPDTGAEYQWHGHGLTLALPELCDELIDLRKESDDSEASTLPPFVEAVELDALRLHQWQREQIRTGTNAKGNQDRSAVLWAVLRDLVRAGASDGQVIGICTDPDNGISAKALEKPNPCAWLLSQVRKARIEINSEASAQANLAGKGSASTPGAPASPAQEPTATLRVCTAADLSAVRDDPAPCVVESLIPRGVVTMGGAHGGIGKTTLAAVLTAHVTNARPWGPFQCEQGRVLFVSLEDPAERIWALLKRACDHYGLDPVAVSRSTVILDGSAAEDSALAVEVSESGVRRLVPTAAYAELLEQAAGFDLIIVDNASDAFDGNENERRLVRKFVRGMLGKIARDNNAGVLLLAHVDKSAARYGAKGNSYSGSTGWHNSARSRLAIVENEAGGLDLIHEKANLGKRADPLRLQMTANGMLEPAAPGGAVALESAKLIVASDANHVFDAISTAIKAGDNVPTGRVGAITTHTMLGTGTRLPKELRGPQGRARFWAALDQLRDYGRIGKETYTNLSRHQRERLTILARAE